MPQIERDGNAGWKITGDDGRLIAGGLTREKAEVQLKVLQALADAGPQDAQK
jgi:hypothetical protein